MFTIKLMVLMRFAVLKTKTPVTIEKFRRYTAELENK